MVKYAMQYKNERFVLNKICQFADREVEADFMEYEKGFDPKMVSAEGMGEVYPVDTNDTPEGRARNRRVEIKVYARHETQDGSPSRFVIPWE